MKLIYLDHAATTALSKKAYDAMQPYLTQAYGNPGGIYSLGIESKKAITTARRQIAACLQADVSEIFFTSGGTEADNWAICGSVFSSLQKNKDKKLHVITSSFEHHAVLETCHFLEKMGIEVTYLNPSEEGFVTSEELEKAIRPNTILVSVMMANNEIGSIQPIKELAKVAHEHGILFHTDAVQTVGHLPISVKELGVDLMSASAHKFGGPKGIGFLYVKQGIVLEPFMHGGGQERGRRAGTENVASIVGMSTAFEEALEKIGREDEETICTASAIAGVRNYLWQQIEECIPDVYLNGAKEKRMPGNLNVLIKDVDSEALLLHLNHFGICASGGSACTSSQADASHVLKAIGLSDLDAKCSVRFSLGEENTVEEMDYVVEKLAEVVEELRALRK